MFRRRTLALAAFSVPLLVGLGAASALMRWDRATTPKEYDGWHRIAWPFPRDGWNEGQAWKGHGMELYVRPKLGLCNNCDTGVVEDAEVDRVTDIDLVDPLFSPVGEGSHIQVVDMAGRMRLYDLRSRKAPTSAIALAISHRCDLIVAIAVGDLADAEKRRIARRFLASNVVQDWLYGQIGTR